jgi:TatD DNase family protein
MKPSLIDSHCHLHFPAYGTGVEAVYMRMRERNIAGITIGTNLTSSKEGIAYANAHDGVYATIGYHPEHLTSSYDDPHEARDEHPYSIEAFRELIGTSKKLVAIGETGLDFFRIDEGQDRKAAVETQERAFREHLALAHASHLPLVIHCRDALTRLAEIVQEEWTRGRRVKGVVHCYTGTWREAQPLLDLGLYLSFTGIITFPIKKDADPEQHMHRVIERMPMDRLLVETDAPYLAPVPHRGTQNEPAYVEYVARTVATLRHTERDDVAAKTTENTMNLFSLDHF